MQATMLPRLTSALWMFVNEGVKVGGGFVLLDGTYILERALGMPTHVTSLAWICHE